MIVQAPRVRPPLVSDVAFDLDRTELHGERAVYLVEHQHWHETVLSAWKLEAQSRQTVRVWPSSRCTTTTTTCTGLAS